MWAKALEHLRLRKGWSKYKLCQMASMPREQYNNILNRSRMGPSLMVLGRLLHGMDYTWHDWAKACDAVEKFGESIAAERSPEYRARKAPSKTSKRPATKPKKPASSHTKS